MVKEIIIGIIVLLIVGFIALQFKSFKDWLVWGVSQAEAYLGSGVGQLKLQYVYNLSIERFPFITKIITFNMFSNFVDAALVKMREMIDNNEKIKNILSDAKIVSVDDK